MEKGFLLAAMEKGRKTKGLQKHNSWSAGAERNEAWERRRRALLLRKGSSSAALQRVTDDDLEELRGCLDLGFGFDLQDFGEGRSRLLQTLPALDLYYAVAAKPVGGGGGGGAESEASDPSPVGSPLSILSPDDTPETVKMRLKQWAKVVALSLRSRS